MFRPRADDFGRTAMSRSSAQASQSDAPSSPAAQEMTSESTASETMSETHGRRDMSPPSREADDPSPMPNPPTRHRPRRSSHAHMHLVTACIAAARLVLAECQSVRTHRYIRYTQVRERGREAFKSFVWRPTAKLCASPLPAAPVARMHDIPARDNLLAVVPRRPASTKFKPCNIFTPRSFLPCAAGLAHDSQLKSQRR